MRLTKWAALLPACLLVCATLAVAQDDYPDVERVTVDELLLAVMKKKPVTIIDVRALDVYDTKIKGALQIPVDEVEARFKEVPRHREVVTYCA